MAEVGCIFCAIVAGTSPARVVHDDDRTLAFLDLFPLTRGHALVVPKVHATNLFEADPDDVAAVARTAQRVGQGAMVAYGAGGLNLLQANGAMAMQTVFHLHVHVLPRYPDDRFEVAFDRRRGPPERLDADAAALRAALG